MSKPNGISSGRGKNDRYAPYSKSVSQRKFEDKMEHIEQFFASDAGTEFIERRGLSKEDLDTFSFDDYSPPNSPLRVRTADGAHREATPDELEDWKSRCPDQYARQQTGYRIAFARALIASGLSYKVSWARAFKKYPSTVDKGPGRSHGDFAKPRYIFDPTTFNVPPKKDAATQTDSPTDSAIDAALADF